MLEEKERIVGRWRSVVRGARKVVRVVTGRRRREVRSLEAIVEVCCRMVVMDAIEIRNG